MKMRATLFLLSLFTFNVFAHDPSVSNAGPVLNKDGSIVSGILTAAFDPTTQTVPFPSNLLFLGSTDGTIALSGSDPNDFTDPFNALSALDGFSTTEKWTTTFIDETGAPASIDPSSVIPGMSVRVFEVTTAQVVAVTGVVRELVPGQDYATAVIGNVLAVIPINPLPELTNFMTVVTNDVRDARGNNATPSTFYHLSKAHSPWIDAGGNSTYPLLDNASAQGAEQLRQITLTMEAAAGAVGIAHEDIILAWTVQTQSITPTLKLLRSIAQPATVLAGPTPFTTAAVGGFGLADVAIGVIELPYYSGIPSPTNPIAPIFDFWKAPPGGYVAPFDQFGFDPTSTNITVFNPFPVPTGTVTVPLLFATPNAMSGFTKPAEGWPVIIYQHGITRNRTDMLAIADAAAKAGFAVVAMDQPLHGVVPAVAPELAPFYIENSPFADLAQERTFDMDVWNNTTGAFMPQGDGITDSSGTSSFNLFSLLTTRDNLRQAAADLSVLAVSLQNISVDGDATPDFNAFNVGAVVHSLGTTVGIPFAAVEPILSKLYINAATGSILRTGLAGDFGARVNAGLAGAGLFPGTADYEAFVTVAQTVWDAGDGINYAAEAAANVPVLHNMVIGDTTVPNTVVGAPVAGSEAVNRAMGLMAFSSSQADPDGLRVVARFSSGEHSSMFRPTFPAVTQEMQGQIATFIGSNGTFVGVGNPDVLVPVIAIERSGADQSIQLPGTGKKSKPGAPGVGPSRLTVVPYRHGEAVRND